MKKVNVKVFNQLKDNYSYIIESKNNSYVSIVDPADSNVHLDYLRKKNLKLENILLTHHHEDHTSGVSDLLKVYPNVRVFSPNLKIKFTTDQINNNSKIITSINKFNIIETPGHTLDHVVFHDDENNLLFSGDTLFRLGCGRIFEGSFDQMYNSLRFINKLSNKTSVYCGHEYTINNYKFLSSISPDSKSLLNCKKEIENQIKATGLSIPFNLGEEKELNPFLNQDSKIAKNLKIKNKLSNLELFVYLREKKDNF